MHDIGFSLGDMDQAQQAFVQLGCQCEMVNLNNALPDKYQGDDFSVDQARVLVIRNGTCSLLRTSLSLIIIRCEQTAGL